MKKYYVATSGQFYIVSRHEFKTDKQAKKWFIDAIGINNGVSLYRYSNPKVMNVFTDRRIA